MNHRSVPLTLKCLQRPHELPEIPAVSLLFK
jgi:hypothetical protein